jgi:hypothetical protein
MTIVGIALDLLINALAGAVERDEVPNPGRFIPTWPEVEARYTTDKPGFGQLLSDYRDEVRTRVNSAVTALGHSPDGAFHEAETFFETNNRPLSLPNGNVKDLSFRLLLEGTSGDHDTREAWKLVDGDAAALTAAMASKTKAVSALRQLRRLDNVVIRWLAAGRAAERCHVPIAEVLALYRTEGNLQVPASTSSIQLGVPTDSLTTPTHVVPSSLRTSVSVRPIGAANHHLLPAIEWMLQLAGLDHVSVKLTRGASASQFVTNFANWSAQNWAVHLPGTPEATPAEARKRWNAFEALVEPQVAFIDPSDGSRVLQAGSAPAGTDRARVATVDDPVEFVAAVLAEGAMFLRRLAQPADVLGALPAGDPLAGERPGTAVYGAISYNAHMGDAMTLPPYNRPNNAHREAVFASGIAAARRSKSARAKPLSTLVKGDAAFAAAVAKFKLGADTDRTKAVDWPVVQAWLRADPARFDALAAFLETADAGEWSSWQPFRAHGSRYRRLLRFYERATAP